MRQSIAVFATVVALALVTLAPLKASAQGVNIYVGPGYPGYAYYPPPYPRYAYGYPRYGYAYPNYGYPYGYGRPYYGTYWGQNRRVARRAYRRWNRWY
jgi:hypothetical protein